MRRHGAGQTGTKCSWPLLSAVRCTVQYVVLPFVLPWIGVAGTIPPWLTLALGVLALGALARNVRYLWRQRHARRWSYLLLALTVGASLLLFTVVDLHTFSAHSEASRVFLGVS